MLYIFSGHGPRRVFCQNTLELIEAKSGAKNCLEIKSRKRDGNESFIKEITPRRTPKRKRR
jgi:hypothetical protein